MLYATLDKNTHQVPFVAFWSRRPVRESHGEAGSWNEVVIFRGDQQDLELTLPKSFVQRFTNIEIDPGAIVPVDLVFTPADPRDVQLGQVRELATAAINSWEEGRQELAADVLKIVGRDQS